MVKKEKNKLQPVNCKRCQGILMLHGMVWDSELKEFRLALECVICKAGGLLIVRPNKTGADQEMKYGKQPSYIG